MVFVNTLAAYGKYPFLYCENLQLPIQMQVSVKRKTLSQFFVFFMESGSNFKHFEKNDDGHSYCSSENTDCERLRHTTL